MLKSLTLFILFLSHVLIAETYDPPSVYLSWQQNPDTTMVIRWITPTSRTDDLIQYKVRGEEHWLNAVGSHISMPDKHPYLIHYIELTALEPNTVYSFRTGEDGAEFLFRTMPSTLSAPIRFVAGGDMYHDDLAPLIETQRQAAATSPHFALLGGDIAYTAPKLSLFAENFERWLDWLKAWKATMVTPDGCLIPMIITIGNHDVIGRFGKSPSHAAFFYSLFVTPQQTSYKVIDFDGYMSVIVLDSGHTNPIGGAQSRWLAQTLENRQEIPNKFALYHVPAYPSIRNPKGPISSEIRMNWVPLFDTFHLTAAFENHDHAYKRSYPLLNGKIDEEDGVLYMGDGAWGIKSPRKEKTSRRWYIKKFSPTRHFILVTLFPNHTQQFQAIDSKGTPIDNYLHDKQVHSNL